MSGSLDIRPEVADALERGHAVVALESTVIAHGLPRPGNLETALGLESLVRAGGAVPATVGVLSGKLVVGLDRDEIKALAETDGVVKVSRRDLARAIQSSAMGATTVAATMFAASRAGIRVFATGGIGGVHRGGAGSLDISADLNELARTPVAVVCAGAKAILDLERTLEVLETNGVPVVGYGVDEFPAFFCRESGLFLEQRVDTAEEASALMRAQWEIGLVAGMVFAAPPPSGSALERAYADRLIATAIADAEAEEIRGKKLTPFLLDRLARLSGGRTLDANVALLEHNAELAARIAVAYAMGDRR